tara:strand:- start:130 stop:594 length:465 start_codon:yes stop_codon:yes gene_type:complete
MASQLTVDNIVGATTAGNVHIPGGVVQIVEGAEFNTQTDVSATSYFDLGLSVTITPKFATSKIFVMTNVHCYINGTGFIALRVLRGSTEVVEAPRAHGWQDNSSAMVNVSKLDSPATTSSTNYKIQVKAVGISNTPRVNDGGGPSRITVMEIAQ